ncbi:ABC transporter ATP-binding protein [Salinirubellus salinus]|jgi:branched-chain amino acid transport system ATP-binding protein|uniref:ABC transporter ATP-binding protein n=1 Tax=Salinirubellus salinus TaxID=1364945 RepID=A0A9E7R1P3_9EURY|nr:ABC transporter ATP-binding protein [Salinirubellus salinus]UWM53243.1 ABC transporter ATP-binding protein [Salinirubellus salinus]
MTTVLETKELRREFGLLVANDDVTVSIDDDEITSIIGPNGAGKTTFYTMLAGQLKPTSGSIRLRPREGADIETDEDGLVEITGKEPYIINRLGLARAYQINNVFDGLTVRDNIRIARISRDGRTNDLRAIATADPELNEGVDRIIELTRLEEFADKKCDNLSHGDKRKVEIALALATDPSVVLLDEPTAGMNATETRKMVDLVRELDKETDTTFVLTEHDMEVVLGISDRILVLDGGSLIAEGTPEEVMANERVREAYLGSEAQ